MKYGNSVFNRLSVVVAGQKSSTVNAAPQLIANSTQGKFVITSAVSKALGIAVGENIQFLNNFPVVENAINGGEGYNDVKAWADEQGIDITTREGADAVLKEFGSWFIAKGVKLYEKTGEPVMGTVRFTEADKKAYIDANAADILEANREALIERVGNPDATDEELIAAIGIDDIQAPTFHAMSGSKTATTGSATGVGAQLNFTDTAIWNSLKSDLKDDKTKKNRIFNVLLDQGFATLVPNGKEDVEVMAYPIEFAEDADPIVREKKEA